MEIWPLKHLKKEEQTKAQITGRKETIKIRAEINEIETKKIKINETKSWLFEKISKTDKPLARLIRKKGRALKSLLLGVPIVCTGNKYD